MFVGVFVRVGVKVAVNEGVFVLVLVKVGVDVRKIVLVMSPSSEMPVSSRARGDSFYIFISPRLLRGPPREQGQIAVMLMDELLHMAFPGEDDHLISLRLALILVWLQQLNAHVEFLSRNAMGIKPLPYWWHMLEGFGAFVGDNKKAKRLYDQLYQDHKKEIQQAEARTRIRQVVVPKKIRGIIFLLQFLQGAAVFQGLGQGG